MASRNQVKLSKIFSESHRENKVSVVDWSRSMLILSHYPISFLMQVKTSQLPPDPDIGYCVPALLGERGYP